MSAPAMMGAALLSNIPVCKQRLRKASNTKAPIIPVAAGRGRLLRWTRAKRQTSVTPSGAPTILMSMRIQTNESKELIDLEIIIRCPKTDEKAIRIISMLRIFDRKMTGTRENQAYIVDVADILYLESVDKHTFFYTDKAVFESNLRLYEFEAEFEESKFFRASKSMIANFDKIESLHPDFNGKICVTLINGGFVMLSRQYVSTIKQKLGLISGRL